MPERKSYSELLVTVKQSTYWIKTIFFYFHAILVKLSSHSHTPADFHSYFTDKDTFFVCAELCSVRAACVTKQLRIVFEIVYTHSHSTYCSTQNIFQACLKLYFTIFLCQIDRLTVSPCLEFFRFFHDSSFQILHWGSDVWKGHKKIEEKHALVQLLCWFLVCWVKVACEAAIQPASQPEVIDDHNI